LTDHPRIRIGVALDSCPSKSVEIDAIVDSGAQSNVWSLDAFLKAGFSRNDLSPVHIQLSAANRSAIRIEGAFFMRLEARMPDGNIITCRAMTYVSSDTRNFYMSYETMLDLGIIGVDFPTAGSAHPRVQPSTEAVADNANGASMPSTNIIKAFDAGCSTSKDDGSTCDCPQREPVPKRPVKLPFPCIPENNGKMKDWLMTEFAASTFNTCPHRLLPCMSGPPVEIHLDPTAKPRACHTAAPIPVHWQQRVYDDLIRDEALGVIERVPYGEPATWCHRMVVTRKHDGSPRRTVDLSPLNKHCKR
jgi:hypothetical protein